MKLDEYIVMRNGMMLLARLVHCEVGQWFEIDRRAVRKMLSYSPLLGFTGTKPGGGRKRIDKELFVECMRFPLEEN